MRFWLTSSLLDGMALSSACVALVYVATMALLDGGHLAREVTGVANALLPGSRFAHGVADTLVRMERTRESHGVRK